MKLLYGDSAARKVSERIAEAVATTALLTAIPASRRVDGMLCIAANTLYQFDGDSTASGAGVLTPDAGDGRWVSAVGGGATDFKDSVRVASTTNLVGTRTGSILLADANGAIAAMDGVTLVIGDRILMKDQTAATDKGIYVITALGAGGAKWSMTRAADFDTSAKVTAGLIIPVSEGTLGGNKVFQLTTNDPIVLNTDPLTFAQTGAAIGSATPEPIGTAAAGTTGNAADEGHIHAHGNQLGGALHANANTTTAGFLTAAHFNFLAGGVKGLCVKGVAATNVADLAAFVVAGFDGVTFAQNDLVLLANQTTGAECGVYIVGAVAGTAPLTRVNWMPTGAILSGGFTVQVNTGTLFANSSWFISTAGAITIGTTAHLWFPESVTQSVAFPVNTGLIVVTNVPVLSATKTMLNVINIAEVTADLTVRYSRQPGTVVAGAVGTASITVMAEIAAGGVNVDDDSTMLIQIVNR